MNQFVVSYIVIRKDGKKAYFNELTNETAGIWLLNAKRRFAMIGDEVVLTFHQMLGYMAPRQHQELEDKLK